MQLKIVSWNIWIDGYFEQIADFLKTSDADIICLQEVKDDDATRDVIGFLKNLGYSHVFAPVQKTWGGKVWNDGLAIFSKLKIADTKTYLLSQTNPRAALRADIQVEDKILHIFNTHLIHTHQQASALQTEQAENLIKLLPSSRTLVMGDFNATPDSETIKKFSGVLVDTDPSSTPTWSVYPEGCTGCQPQAIDTRLDYIFTTGDIKTNSFKVEHSKASDHLPVSVIIET